jgi:hypothetical protein
MNMKKILLAGIALGSLAATAANAAVISSARISSIDLSQASTPTERLIYSNAVDFTVAANRDLYGVPGGSSIGAYWTSATALTAANTLVGSVDTALAQNFLAGSGIGNTTVNTYRFTFDLGGTAAPAFATALTSANFSTVVATASAAECVVGTPTLSLGGGIGASTAVVDVSVNSTAAGTAGCNGTNAPTGLRLIFPATNAWKVSATTPGTVTASVKIDRLNPTTLLFEAYAGGASGTTTLAEPRALTEVLVSNVVTGVTTLPTSFAIAAAGSTAPNYIGFVTSTGYDAIIGSVRAGYFADNVTNFPGISNSTNTNGTQSGTKLTFVGVNGALKPLISPELTFTNSGSFAAFRPAVAGITISAPTGALQQSIAGTAADSANGLAVTNVTVAVNAGNSIPVSTPQTITLAARVKPAAAATYLNPSLTVTNPLEIIGQQGTYVDAPWISGNVAAFPSIIRMTNNGTSATGPISLALSSVVDGVAGTPRSCTSTGGTNVGALPALAGIAPGGELLVDTAAVTTCFGNFRRGDLRITFQGSSDSVSIKQRIISGSVASESSLGLVTDGGKTNQ